MQWPHYTIPIDIPKAEEEKEKEKKRKKKRKGEKGEGGEDGDGITRRRDNISKNKFLKEGIEEHKCRVNCGIKADIITNKAKNIE